MAYSIFVGNIFFRRGPFQAPPPPPGKAEVRGRKVPIKAHNESGTGLCKAARCKTATRAQDFDLLQLSL